MKATQRGLWSVVGIIIGALALPIAGSAHGLHDAPVVGLSVQSGPAGTALSLDGEAAFHVTRNEVRSQRLIAVPGSATRLMLWNEVSPSGRSVSFYAISLDGKRVDRLTETSYTLKLQYADFDPAVATPSPRGELAGDARSNLYIVQFVTQPLPEFRQAIESLDGTVRQFIANHAHIVQMSPATRDAVSALPFVRWVGPYHPAYRLEQCLQELATSGKGIHAQRYNIMTFEGGLTQKQTVASRIRALGGYVDSGDYGKRLVVATLTPDQLYEVARWDEVLFIDRWSAYQKDMNNIRVMGGANYLEGVAGYTGQGVRGEVFDAGFNLGHVDFQSRPLIQHGAVGSDSHGASTSGIVFGDGTGNPSARGMLPSGQGIVGDYNTIGLEGTSRYNHTGEQVQAPYFCVFETSSVGSTQVSNYTTISADTDDMLFDFDVVHCQSQSNMGSTASRPQAWAKNIISGGAAYHYDTQAFTDDCWCSGASIGPAADGRIKPDLCAAYDDIWTTSGPGSTAYDTGFGGTSGATPIIAGHVGLFFQMWSAGIFGNTIDPFGSVFDNRCHMTTAKAVMINNGQQYTFSGTGDLTRVHQGWGWPSVQRIYDMREKMFIVDESRLLTNLETAEYTLNVEAGEPQFRATLVYADPAGVPGAAQARINDLTLQVVSPAGTTYWGNNGLLTGNYSTAGGSANHVDTVENVFVQNPASGIWIVRVIAEEINQDSHIESPALDADFALVVSGVTPCSSAGTVRLNREVYPCASTAEIRALDCDLNIDPDALDTVTVSIVSTSDPIGQSVLLTETGLGTASFAGTIALGPAGGAGTLQVANGDTLTVTYIDADNGLGGTDVTVTDTAVVDCLPPTIANVHATDLAPRTAKVTFDCNEPARGRVHYGLSCGALTGTASASTYDLSPVVSLTGLTDATTYFYSVEAEDQAGNITTDDNSGACYTFTTPDIPDFFTQLFTTDNDLDNLSLIFVPNGSSDFYHACDEAISALPTNPTGGTTLSLTDDSYALVAVGGGNTVKLYGVSYGQFYVGSNGYITFSSGDSTYTESLDAHFNQPRVSALFDDLNPSQGGTVSWKQLADRMAVTWLGVTEHSAGNANTLQIELYFNGQITISYLAVAATDGLAGLSAGGGTSPDFFMSDLSALGSCQTYPPVAQNASVSTPESTAINVLLPATDDGMPNPPGALIYIVTALPLHGQLSDPNGGAINAVPYTLLNGAKVVRYTPHLQYVGSDTFQFKANDGGTPPDGGDSNVATITVTMTGVPQMAYSFPLDTDPGWTKSGSWAFGDPDGLGSHAKDPGAGHTGDNVYGYNLNGDYINDMPAYYLTTTAINCSNLVGVQLRFWRWLGVEQYDHAAVAVSNNGTSWTTVWDSFGTTFNEAAWSQKLYSIAATADHQATVYIRWTMGPTDATNAYPGWNIDDVELWGLAPPAWAVGDLNCDGVVDFADINPFVLALSNPGVYATTFLDCDIMNGDINDDGSVSFADINPFVALLSGGE